MASATSTKYEWIVILPDEDGALERRMKVRPEHFNNIKPRVEEGFWLMGGGFLEDVPKEGQPLKLKGSVMLAWAESKEQVMKELEEDVYFKNDVWHKSKIQIYPFKSAFRKPT